MTMRPLDCASCGLRVLVEKFSSVHLSVQWTTDAAHCPLISARDCGVGHRERGCPELHRSIDRAVHDNELTTSSIELPAGATIPRLH
ncbi:hypothetical protein ABZ413_25060 [Nocardia rhamnosiphila]|uniref:hypothetical protein n=1 Tax=Nocardia rhamnosiphila TaxID=426716 RepID=UPI0033ECB6AF